MPIEYVTDALVPVPASAVGGTVAGPGSAWTSTAFVELIASTATAIILAGITFRAGTTGIEVEVDIARGGAGSEVVVATLRMGNRANSANSPWIAPFPFPIDNIGSGQRVSFRVRLSTNNTGNYLVTLHYYATGSIGTITATAQPSLVYPPAGDGISIAGPGTAWQYSAWTELVAATTAAIVIPALVILPPNSTFDWEVDLGIGIAGSEAVLTTARGHVRSTNGVLGPAWHQFIPALDNVPAGSRLAVRLRKSGTFAGATLIAAMYYGKPL